MQGSNGEITAAIGGTSGFGMRYDDGEMVFRSSAWKMLASYELAKCDEEAMVDWLILFVQKGIWLLLIGGASWAVAQEDTTKVEREAESSPATKRLGRSNEGAKAKSPDPLDRTVEKLVSEVLQSIVTIRATDRDGAELGLGTGFVIDSKGLIATNFHVISEGRPLTVELWPDKKLRVLAVEASSRRDDLAILRVEPSEHKLIPLTLSNEDTIAQGASVLAIGNPLGLRHSVVQGIVSAVRDIEEKPMIQIAIPIEPGNSGGPLIDLEGTVHGIISMKSAVEKNVGFAIPIARLRSLIEAPNPIVMERWVRLAGMDPTRWKIPMGGNWQERSGIIRVTAAGSKFGGRVLCLSQQRPPADAFEVAVDVKLDDETGAAGLVFQADGGDRHYGFYPSHRKLRLTCFDGATVFQWEVIREEASPHYVADDWNRLKVSVDGDRIQCFINEVKVYEVRHSKLSSGQVGLAAFRGTSAEFRRFRLAANLDEHPLDPSTLQKIAEYVEQRSKVESLDESTIRGLAETPTAAARELERQAALLNRQADGLRRLAVDVELASVFDRLKAWGESSDGDLLQGSLLIAALAHSELDIESYRAKVDQMAEEIRKVLGDNPSDGDKLLEINRYLFDENGFHGGQDEFYHQANNLLDRVIDDREGMPITLCVLYMELGKRLGVTLEGVGLPGRFVVRYRSADGETKLIDVFEKAAYLNDTEVAMMVMMNRQRLTIEEDMRTQTPVEIATRILRNLVSSAEQTRDYESMRRYAEGLVILHPDLPEYRWMRALMRYQTERLSLAAEDLDWLLENPSEGLELEQIIKLRTQLDRELADRTR